MGCPRVDDRNRVYESDLDLFVTFTVLIAVLGVVGLSCLDDQER